MITATEAKKASFDAIEKGFEMRIVEGGINWATEQGAMEMPFRNLTEETISELKENGYKVEKIPGEIPWLVSWHQ